MNYEIGSPFAIPVIDVPATSKNLKSLREAHNITVAQIQQFLGMENPQSIYTWENAESKVLPRLDNLVTLAKLYKVTIDELIVIRTEKTDGLAVCEPVAPYGVSKDALDFVRENASSTAIKALEKYYGFSIGYPQIFAKALS
ncbi:MAG: helix-turn-helix transcriptional regulator [Treponema sp.]|nr:helix-turn-helix transcriptional regulator [Treponema sp.]